MPRAEKIEPLPLRSMQFIKHEWGKEKKRKAEKSIYDVRADHKRTTTQEILAGILEEVKVEQKTGKIIGLSLILPQELPGITSCNQSRTPAPEPTESRWDLTSPQGIGPSSMTEIKERAEATTISIGHPTRRN